MANNATQLDKYKKIRRGKTKLVTMAVLCLFAIAVLIGAVSYYGDHVGNFFIGVEKDSRAGLSLCESYDFEDPRDILTPMGIDQQTNTSYFQLPIDKLNQSEGGVHSDFAYREYFAYTFFVQNASMTGQLVDYDVKMSLRTASRNLDEAIRIMLIKDRDIANARVFAKPDVDPSTKQRITAGGKNITTTFDGTKQYESDLFINDNEICSIPIKAFPAQAKHIYTIIIWLEGDDPDCTDSIKRGTIMVDMEFNISKIIDP